MNKFKVLVLIFALSLTNLLAQNASYIVNGNASSMGITGPNGNVNCNCFQLTPSQQGQVGSVWNENKINLNESIRIEFDIYLGNNDGGADGVVFGLQKLSTSIGVSGGGMGMQGVSPSLGVYIDTYQNIVAPDNHNDPASDHISINRNGDLNHSTANNLSGPVGLANIEDNQWRRFIFDWESSTTTLKIYLVNTVSPVLTYTGDIVTSIFGGDSLVFWGFTGSTGFFHNLQKFCTVTDLESPEITSCPIDVTMDNSPGDCFKAYTYPAITASDNCGTVTVSQISGLSSGSNFPVGQTENIFVATDGGGNTDTCRFTVTVNDTSGPVVNCPADQNHYYDQNCEFTIIDFSSLVSTTDNCDNSPTLIQSPAVGSLVSSDTVISFLSTDESGNSSTCTFNLLLTDSISPQISCPANQNDFYNSNCEFTLLDYTSLVTSSDNCDPTLTVTQFPVTGSTVSSDTTIQLTVTDDSGNSSTCTFDLLLTDSISPQISCPANQNDFYNSNCEFTIIDYTLLLLNSDNCDPALTITQSPLIGSIVNSDTVIQFTATDDSGNSSSCIFSLTLSDTTSPQLTCPSNQSDYFDSNCEFILLDYSSLLTSNDNCDASLNITQSPLAGSTVNSDTTIQFTVTDDYGNSTTCSFNLDLIDTISPSVNCNPLNDVYYTTNCDFAVIDFTNSVSILDNCDTTFSISQFPTIGNTIYTDTNINFTVTDQSGNQSTCSSSLVILDTIKPSVICPPNQTVYLDTTCVYIMEDYSHLSIVSDNCDTIFNFTHSISIGSPINRDTTVLLTVSDLSTNVSSCVFSLQVFDTIPPEITCPNDTIISTDPNSCLGTVNYRLPVGFDYCETVIPQLDSGLINGNPYQKGIHTAYYSVVDSALNTASCSYNVIIVDAQIPNVDCITDTTIILNTSCEYEMENFLIISSIFDNCGLDSISQNPLIGSTLDSNFIITLSAYDSTGNSNSCQINVNLIDTVPPVVICPNNQSVNLSTDCEYRVEDFESELVVYDDCGIISSVTQFPSYDSIFDFIGTDTIQFVVSDNFGNLNTCQFVIDIQNNPMFDCNEIFIPTVFSPDGDGINDVFNVVGLELQDLELIIYSRWGSMVYKRDVNQGGWDGKFEGVDVPSGTYVYFLIDTLNDVVEKEGTISLVRFSGK